MLDVYGDQIKICSLSWFEFVWLSVVVVPLTIVAVVGQQSPDFGNGIKLSSGEGYWGV